MFLSGGETTYEKRLPHAMKSLQNDAEFYVRPAHNLLKSLKFSIAEGSEIALCNSFRLLRKD
jgi:hypothetical protein